MYKTWERTLLGWLAGMLPNGIRDGQATGFCGIGLLVAGSPQDNAPIDWKPNGYVCYTGGTLPHH